MFIRDPSRPPALITRAPTMPPTLITAITTPSNELSRAHQHIGRQQHHGDLATKLTTEM